MKKGECESFDKKHPETTLKKNMKGDNTEFSQKKKMNKVVYEQKLLRNTLSPFFPPRCQRPRSPASAPPIWKPIWRYSMATCNLPNAVTGLEVLRLPPRPPVTSRLTF